MATAEYELVVETSAAEGRLESLSLSTRGFLLGLFLSLLFFLAALLLALYCLLRYLLPSLQLNELPLQGEMLSDSTTTTRQVGPRAAQHTHLPRPVRAEEARAGYPHGPGSHRGVLLPPQGRPQEERQAPGPPSLSSSRLWPQEGRQAPGTGRLSSSWLWAPGLWQLAGALGGLLQVTAS